MIGLDHERAGRLTLEDAAQGGERLAQAAACLGFASLAPQQAREPLARHRGAVGERQDGDQRLALLGRNGDFVARGRSQRETAQQLHLKSHFSPVHPKNPEFPHF